MSNVTIYHNPRCSKSRATLDLLRNKGVEPTIIKYLDNPPDVNELKHILQLLHIDASSLIRKKESLFKELDLGNDNVNEDTLIKAMTEHPRLIERPIVINRNQAAIGRPPEAVLAVIDKT